MALITLFDPWRGEFCTCPKKYSLNPYTGCEHGCLYCYITSYIPDPRRVRAKKDLLASVKRERKKLNRELPISMSNSSDPYPPAERDLKLTRACLGLLRDFKVLLITKSSLVARDANILADMRACVSITITTMNEELAMKLEPNAPPPDARLKALENLVEKGVPVACRIDPILPGLNEEQRVLVKELSAIGAGHVVASTYKLRPDSWGRLKERFDCEAMGELYFTRGERRGNAYYLPRDLRFGMMKRVKELCDSHGLTFATCREGLPLNTAPSCDGTHLIPERQL